MRQAATPPPRAASGGAPAPSRSPPVLAKGTASDERNATRTCPLNHTAPHREARAFEPNLTAKSGDNIAKPRRVCQERGKWMLGVAFWVLGKNSTSLTRT